MTALSLPAGPGTRRGTELVLLVFAVLLGALGYAAVGIAQDGHIPSGTLGYGLGLGALFGIAHLAVRRFAPYADPLVLPCVALLNGLGIVIIRRLDFGVALRAHQTGHAVPRPDAPLQLIWTGVGVAALLAVLLVVRDHTRLARYTYTSAAAGLVLLLRCPGSVRRSTAPDYGSGSGP